MEGQTRQTRAHFLKRVVKYGKGARTFVYFRKRVVPYGKCARPLRVGKALSLMPAHVLRVHCLGVPKVRTHFPKRAVKYGKGARTFVNGSCHMGSARANCGRRKRLHLCVHMYSACLRVQSREGLRAKPGSGMYTCAFSGVIIMILCTENKRKQNKKQLKSTVKFRVNVNHYSLECGWFLIETAEEWPISVTWRCYSDNFFILPIQVLYKKHLKCALLRCTCSAQSVRAVFVSARALCESAPAVCESAGAFCESAGAFCARVWRFRPSIVLNSKARWRTFL